MEGPVVLDARPLQPGFKSHLGRGIGRYTKNLIQALLQEESAPEFKLLLQAGLPEPELPRELPRCYLPSAPSWLPGDKRVWNYHALAALRLSKTVRGTGLVHFFAHLDAPALVRAPAVLTVHDLIFQRLKQLYSTGRAGFELKRWLETRCLFQARRIISVSEQTKRDLIELYKIPGWRITVIPEGPDPGLEPQNDPLIINAVLERHGLSKNEPFFLYLGGIDQRKGMQYLLKALTLLREQGLDHTLALAGKIENDAQYPGFLDNINKLGLQDRVKLLGYVPDEDLPPLFAGCLGFVFPSLYEGFGLPPLEAMTCGAPVVAARCRAVMEVVGEAGILVESKDASQLAEAMARLITEPGLASRLRELGKKQADKFTWRAAARSTLQLYAEALK